jgi:hypothetical protein
MIWLYKVDLQSILYENGNIDTLPLKKIKKNRVNIYVPEGSVVTWTFFGHFGHFFKLKLLKILLR